MNTTQRAAETYRIRHESGSEIGYRNTTGRDFDDMLRFLSQCGYVEVVTPEGEVIYLVDDTVTP
jgi:hypothetical protein